MAFLDISVFLHEFMLDFFKLRTVDFLELAAFYTNEMAVLVLVTQGTFSEVHPHLQLIAAAVSASTVVSAGPAFDIGLINIGYSKTQLYSAVRQLVIEPPEAVSEGFLLPDTLTLSPANPS